MGKQYGCLITIFIITLYLTEPSDSLNWTAQPANPTEVMKGQDVSLTWNFSLTANEQADRQLFYSITWRRFNRSSASYDTIASRIFVQVIGTVQYAEPQAPHIVVDRAKAIDSATLQIKNAQSDDEERYKIEYSVKIYGPPAAAQEFNLTVLAPPNITDVSSDQVVCEGSMVALSCNVTGNPTPNITWTRAFDNGTDSAPLLPVVDGKYVMNNIMRSSNGTYRCTADNRVGDPVNQTVTVTVRYSATVVRIVNLSNTVNEGGSFSMTCEASGNPKPNVLWIKMDNGQRIDGSLLNFTNINRNDTGRYRCKAANDCGNDTRVQSVKVYYPPEIVSAPSPQQVVEGDGVVLFCNATGYPPPNITWTKQGSSNVLSLSETLQLTNLRNVDNGAVYICKVENILGSREANAMITVLYAPNVAIQKCSTPVNEGQSATFYCNAIGNPAPRTVWIKQSTGEVIYNETLILPNMKRNESGIYECLAWNGVGNNTKSCTIDVYYRPSSSALTIVPSNTTVLHGKTLLLICSTDANPLNSVTYHFYFNNRYIGNSSSSLFNVTVEADGLYTCVPINTVGTGENATVSVTAVVAPSIEVHKTTYTVVEGSRITLFCNASGEPTPSIKWIRVGSSEVLFNTSILTVMNVSRPGTPDNIIQYKCTASNGVESPATAVSNITVYYPPEIISAPSPQQVVEGDGVVLFCNTTGYPPPNITWTKQGSSNVLSASETLQVTNLMSGDNGAVYICKVENVIGYMEANAMITVLYAPNVAIQKCSTPVNEGQSATFYCNATGNPVPNTAWIKKGTGEVIYNETLILPNMKRNESGIFECLAWNGVGNNSTKSCTIDVYYPPKITRSKAGAKEAERGAIIKCDAEGNPSPTYLWRNGTGGVVAREKTFTLTHEGNYTCNASNEVGFDTRSIVIEIPSDNYQGEVPVEKLNGVAVDFKPEYNDLNSLSAKEFLYKFGNEMDKLYANDSTYSRTEVTGLSNGSVILSFMLYFTTPVTTSEGLAKLRAAADNGTLGPFTVGALKIIQNVIATGIPSVSPTGATTVADPTEEKTASSPSGISTTLEFTLTITNKDCKVRSEVEQKLLTEIPKTVQYLGGLKDIKIQEIRCGSIIVDFLLRFNQSVVAVDVISALITAVRQGKFGNFSVDTNSIKQRKLPSIHTDTRDTSTQDTSTQDTSTQDTSTQDTSTQDTSTQDPVCNIPSFIKDENCKVKIWKVVVLVVAVVVTMALVLGIAACWLHRRRKFRKEHRSQCALGTRRKNETAM